jgi:hypothetical protein
MTTLLNATRDINGFNVFGLPVSSIKFQGILTAGSEKTITVPESSNPTYKTMVALFSFAPGSSVWVSKNETAEAPTGDPTVTTSELNPTERVYKGGDVIHMITNDASDEWGIVLYATN